MQADKLAITILQLRAKLILACVIGNDCDHLTASQNHRHGP
jgi:hypothetical protein